MARWLAVVAAVAALAPGLAVGADTTKSKGLQHFFFGPGPTTSCEMDFDMPKIGTDVYCQTYAITGSGARTESVILHANGKIATCHGIKCIGNPPDQVPTLVYGSWLTLGPFRCDSTHAGVKCYVVKTGKGFLIAPTSIKPVG
jgi:hypothetical protein